MMMLFDDQAVGAGHRARPCCTINQPVEKVEVL